ncbi:hypothetical protein M2459_002736 [Parabacteroides sp. PF5-5]|uniref:hypothetical protein n=1 Tax=unclassified Parabacteroides TaxID=2649774 RepID=UPI0024765E52|nr:MULTISPECIES: hypothetical protein [unclassified Parabacteroides]MDH6306120.1 hypothetical protein [Parabacteroides sp. PH5-39]MDH6316982.1 hypothetical protein [Parabacteroides sp. PF5-13]MDH6320735.1 hypothetical protein [Parabacteroides sp. PH5-13]MDH6324563.1 hypothetical protein [Parabacteroides sp. PH5-8]MDH6328167.1 hypothetical protein [Parabacteroides sp. PH5-41]
MNLTKCNRQPFLDYLHKATVMGSLRFKVENPILLRKVIWLLEGGVRERKSSSWDLCSSLLYGMDFGLKVNSLHQYMRTDIFITDDMVELLEIPLFF